MSREGQNGGDHELGAGGGDRDSALQHVLRALGAVPGAADALTEIANAACEWTCATSAAIGLLDSTGSQLQFVAVSGRSARDLVGLNVNVSDSLAEEALRTGCPQTYASTHLAALSLQDPLGARSCAVAPILRDGKSVGALMAMSTRFDDAMSDSLRRALMLLADAAGVALDRTESARRQASQARELSVLYRATQRIGTCLNVQEILTSVLEAICGHLEHQAAALFLINDDRTHLFVMAERGLSDEEREIQMAADAPPLSTILESGEAVLLSGEECEPVLQGLLGDRGVRSAIVAPVCSRADALGLMVLLSGQPNVYASDDLRLVSVLASQAGVAIQNASLYEDAMRHIDEAGAIYNLSHRMNATRDLAQVLAFVADSVPTLLNVEEFAIQLLDARDNRLTTRVYRGDRKPDFSSVRPRLGEGIAGWVCQWGTPTAVADVAANARNHSARIEGAGAVSALCVPIALAESVIGVMIAMSSRRRLFTVAEMELLYTVANHAAAAISNAMRYREVRGRSAELQRVFGRIATALGHSFQGERAVQLTADLVVATLRADRCTVYRVESGRLLPAAIAGRRTTGDMDLSLPLGEGLTGGVGQRGVAVALATIAEDPDAAGQPWHTRERPASYVGVPIKLGRRTVGVVEVLAYEPRPYVQAEARLVSRFLRQSGIAACLVPTAPT